MDRAYYVRYGLPRHVGVFPSPQVLGRGDSVVIRTGRGTELGEVLTEAVDSIQPPQVDSSPRILRAASGLDLDASRRAISSQDKLFDAFRNVFDEAVWPLQIVDVEPLLEADRTVLYYLGPHRLDFGGLREAFRSKLGVEVAFEPVGKDAEPLPDEVEAEGGGGSCGSSEGGCGSGGGCGDGGGGCSSH